MTTTNTTLLECILDFLSKTKPFDQLSVSSLEQLAFNLQPLRYRAGQTIFSLDTTPPQIAILYHGQARLLGYAPESSVPELLHEFRPGEVFGWASLIRGIPCENVVASGEVFCLTLSSADFFSLLQEEPQLAQAFQNRASLIETFDLLGIELKRQDKSITNLKELALKTYLKATVLNLPHGRTPLSQINPNFWWLVSSGKANFAVGSRLLPGEAQAYIEVKSPFVRLIGLPEPSGLEPPQSSSNIKSWETIPYAPENLSAPKPPASKVVKKDSQATNNGPVDKTRTPFKLDTGWRWFLIGLALIGIGITLYFFLLARPNPDKYEKFLTTVEQVSTDVRITSAGTVAPNRKANVGPKDQGLLTELYVEQGQAVKKGQILARMDSSRLVHEVEEAKAAADAARARYLESRNGSRRQDISQAEAERRSAQARFSIAQDNYNRFKQLRDEGVVNNIDFNTRSLELDQAWEALKGTEQKLNLLKTGSRYEQVLAAKAEVDRTRALLANARSRFNDLTIRAPFTGIVSQRYAQAGSFVSPNSNTQGDSATSSSILLLIDRLEVLATVAESDIARIQVGQPVEITTTAFPGKIFKGKVRLVAPEAVQDNGITQFQVRVQLNDEAAKTLKSRLNVTVNFIAGEIKDTLAVPTAAVITNKAGKTGVLVPDPKKGPVFREVISGQNLGDKTQIVSGLKEGAQIFTKVPPDFNIEEISGSRNAFR
ncbi:MAG: efflux RND transporter periplasmic adaptor subunit [Kovacikia sp.]